MTYDSACAKCGCWLTNTAQIIQRDGLCQKCHHAHLGLTYERPKKIKHGGIKNQQPKGRVYA